ncbi:hypothetical protein ACHAWF_001123 [Thalassiosira exigua]
MTESKPEPKPKAEPAPQPQRELDPEPKPADPSAPPAPPGFGAAAVFAFVAAAFLAGAAGGAALLAWSDPESAAGAALRDRCDELLRGGSSDDGVGEGACLPGEFSCNEADAAEASEADARQHEMAEDVIRWIRDNDGFVSEKVFLHKPADGGPRGIYANGTFEEGERICSIPWDLMLKPSEEWVDPEDRCGTIEALYEDMKDDKTPYGRYIKSMPRNYLPHWWSEEGKALLRELLGPKLPPEIIRNDDFFREVYKDCEVDRDDDLESHAEVMVTARGDDELLVPFYDMINHRNGPYYNVKHIVHDAHARSYMGKPYELVASRRIERGEQLHNSYNQCPICYGRRNYFGTPDVFAYYGFVEAHPQRYVVDQVRLKFDVAEREDGSGEVEARFAVPPSVWGVDYLKEEVERLRAFERKHRGRGRATTAVAKVPKSEREAIWEFRDAVTKAFEVAIEGAEGVADEAVWKCDEDWWQVENWKKRPCKWAEER